MRSGFDSAKRKINPVSKRTIIFFLIIMMGFLAIVVPALAGDQILKADATLKRLQTNQLTLIDIRSPQEWRQTGIAKGAKTITIHDPLGATGFVAKVMASLRGKLDRPIALICAVGVRSTRASQILKRVGFKRVYNVREGMLGNTKDGPGWLKRGLPVEH